MLATLEVQRAIYETLTDFGLNVYSTLPINTPLPYVQFTNIEVSDASNKSVKRQEYIVSLSCWCVDTTSMDIHMMTETVLDIVDVELDLGEKFSHDSTSLEFLRMNQDEMNTEIINRSIIELRIEVSEN